MDNEIKREWRENLKGEKMECEGGQMTVKSKKADKKDAKEKELMDRVFLKTFISI